MHRDHVRTLCFWILPRAPQSRISASMLSLTLLLLIQAPAEQPAQIRQQAEAAVEGDSIAVVRSRWERRLTSHPDDRAALYGLGTLSRLTDDYAAADTRFAQLTGNDRWAQFATFEQAYGELFRKPFDQTALRFMDVATRARASNDSLLASASLAIAAFLGSRLGILGASIDSLDVAMRLAPADELVLRARILCTKAPILSFAGRPGAMDAVQQGLALLKIRPDRRAAGLCYHAGAMVAINDVDDATLPEVYTDSAIAVQAAARETSMLALSWYTKGYSRYSYSDLAGGKQALTQAIILAEQSDNPFVIAWSRRMLSSIYWTAGDVPAAAQDFAQAESIFTLLNDGFGLSNVRNGKAAALLSMGRIAAAESGFRAQLAVSERNGMAEGVFANLQSLSGVRASRGDWKGAMDELDRAIAYGNANGHAGWTASLDYRRGVIALRLGDLDAAEQLLQRFQRLLSPEQYFDRYAVQTRLAEIAARRGRLDDAVAGLLSASRQLDSMRHSLTDVQLRLLVFQTRSALDEPDLGLAPTAAILVPGGRAEAAFMLSERRRARTLEEQVIRSAALRGDSVRIPEFAEPGDLAALQQQLPAGLAVISYLAGRGTTRTSAFVVTRDTLLGVVLSPLDSISRDLDRYVALIREGEATNGPGERIAAALLLPVVAQLPAGVDRLVIIPDDRMHRVPFDALPLRDGEPLLAMYGVSRAPSLAVAIRLARRPRHAGPASILAFGDPFTGEADTTGVQDPVTERYRRAFAEVGGLPSLRATRGEVVSVGRHSRVAMVRLGDQASEAWLKQSALTHYRIIHLASHALVDDQSESRTSLALAPGDGEDGFLGASEISALRLDADLVVLSACRTAAGRVIGGEGVQGLVAPLMGAGARTIVASMWPVGDRATALLMRDFYDEMAEGKTIGEALRAAKLTARKRGEPASVWAAFTLVGDPDTRLQLQQPSHLKQYLFGALLLLLTAILNWIFRARKARTRVLANGGTPHRWLGQ